MPAADLVLKNASVITMEPESPAAGLVAIKGNRIALVGGTGDLAAVTGYGTRVIDCQGKTVIPGFNDAHCHIFSFLRKQLSVDLGPSSVRSIAEIKAAIRREAEKTPPGKWISGTGFNEFYLAEKRCPNRWDIDEVAPAHPVVLSQRSLHACVLNSLALSIAGIYAETPDPPGALIDREPTTGEPTGLLFEMLGYIREKIMPPPSAEELDRSVASANQYYLSCGITSLQEATVTNNLDRWQIYRRFKDAGKLKSRISMMVRFDALTNFHEAGLAPGTGDSHLRLGAVKIIVNESTGRIQPDQSELNQQALIAQRAGYQVAIHAIEPNTVDAAITALEYIKAADNRRHRIEHCAVCPPPLLDRLRRLKAVVVTQPPFIYYNGERYLATVPASHQPWLYRIKSFLDSGVAVAAGSDSPIAPGNPLVGIYAAVTRQAESGQRVLPGEAITAGQALTLYTLNAAYASFEEKNKGSIVPGKLADLVVLSADPTRAPLERIKDIRVEMTIIDGEVVWEA